MATLKFKRFTKPRVLMQIGRGLLDRFFDRFKEDLAAKNVQLPSEDVHDDEYFQKLAGALMAPEGLPEKLSEVLFAIDEMANEEGHERLLAAVRASGLELSFDEKSTHADVAMQVWLAKPDLLVEKHNELRLSRLATFEYFGSKAPMNRGETVVLPDQAVLELLAADLDAWCKEHNRGEQTAHIEVHQWEDEFWFLVRHGDTFARTPKVERRLTEVLHYRPAKDDVVVYSQSRNEIRIHADTKGERELYRTTFGKRLFDDDEYFSERKAYTLEPLREDGWGALDTDGIPKLDRVVLVEIEILYGGTFKEVVVRKADDIFTAAKARERTAIPGGGRVVRAGFDFYFKGAKKPRKIQVRPPNILKLCRYCDAAVVQQWLSARGFRSNVAGGEGAGSSEGNNVEGVGSS